MAALPMRPHARPMLLLRRLGVPLMILLVALSTGTPWAAGTATAGPLAAPATPVGVWPLDPVPEVVNGFDPPDTTYGAGHRGVDLLGHVGQRVRSALPGRVSFAGRLAGRGVVVVDHGETRTTYEPVTAALEVGAVVSAGDVVGRLELVGSHCFPRACLHWGWIRGEAYLDPLLLVGAGPVRLLPLWRDRPVGSSGSTRASPYAAWRPLAHYARGCACW